MTENPDPKSGFKVSDLQSTVKKFGLEIVVSLIFILSGIFSLVWGGGILVWSIIALAILGVVGALLASSMHKFLHQASSFCQKDKATSIIIAIVAIILSIVFPPITFAIIGLYAGEALLCTDHGRHDHHSDDHSTPPPPPPPSQ